MSNYFIHNLLTGTYIHIDAYNIYWRKYWGRSYEDPRNCKHKYHGVHCLLVDVPEAVSPPGCGALSVHQLPTMSSTYDDGWHEECLDIFSRLGWFFTGLCCRPYLLLLGYMLRWLSWRWMHRLPNVEFRVVSYVWQLRLLIGRPFPFKFHNDCGKSYLICY